MTHVLLVEDYLPDVRLTQRAFKKAAQGVQISHVVDGVEALSFLRKEGRHTTATFPDFVLLDLNMPRMDGRAFLVEVRKDPLLAHLPIVVLTTSSQDHDVKDVHRLGANAYVVKPVKYEDFQRVVNNIDTFWAQTAKLPRAEV